MLREHLVISTAAMDPRLLLVCACVAAVSASSELTCVEGSQGIETEERQHVETSTRGPTVLSLVDVCANLGMFNVGNKVKACSDDTNINLIFDSMGEVRIIVADNAETLISAVVSCSLLSTSTS